MSKGQTVRVWCDQSERGAQIRIEHDGRVLHFEHRYARLADLMQFGRVEMTDDDVTVFGLWKIEVVEDGAGKYRPVKPVKVLGWARTINVAPMPAYQLRAVPGFIEGSAS